MSPSVSAPSGAFETADALPDGCRTAMRHLLIACADTKLLLGYHYGEWTFGTPALEAAVASCSLAQGELGHVRLLHGVLQKHYGDDPEDLMERREAAAFANVPFLDRAVPDWPGFVTVNYLVDLAVTRLLDAMRGTTFLPLRMSLDKMLDEERYHIHHGQGWFRTLARGGGKRAERLRVHAVGALRALAEWFGPPDDPEDRALVEAGCKRAPNAAVFRTFLDDVHGVAGELGVTLASDAPTDFTGWTPARRRCGDGGPDDEILYHLRGSKNAIFKLRG